jgi:hypothetical protein
VLLELIETKVSVTHYIPVSFESVKCYSVCKLKEVRAAVKLAQHCVC